METEIEHRRPATRESNLFATALTLAVFTGVVGAAAAAAYKIGEQSATAKARAEATLRTLAKEKESLELKTLRYRVAELEQERDGLRRALLVYIENAPVSARPGQASMCFKGKKLVLDGQLWRHAGTCQE